MKTIEMWHESKKGLSEFLQIGDIIDESIQDYIIGVLPPVTMNSKVIQMGEPYSHDDNGHGLYLTIEKKDERWIYTGIKCRVCPRCHSTS